MPRKPGPWYRVARKRWFVTMNGQQVDLGVTDPSAAAQALAAWKTLLQQGGPQKPIAAKVTEYLERAGKRVKPHTLTVYRWCLGKFLDWVGDVLLADLTADAVEESGRRTGWSSSTRNSYLGAVGSFLTWAGHRLRIRKPPKQSAGARSVISDETYRCLLTHCQHDWGPLVQFLWHTGCRSGEATALTVEMVDWEHRMARLVEHKTSAHGHDRVIYLSAEAFAVLEGQRLLHHTGLLFRSRGQRAFTRAAVVRKFGLLSRKVGRRCTAKGFRHSWASRALAGGESDTIVAHLMGHSSTAMIARHYAHLSQHGRELADAARRIGKTA